MRHETAPARWISGSADTAGTYAVGTIFGYTVQTYAVCTTFSYAVRTNAIGATFGYAVQAYAIGATFGYPIRTNAIGTTFGYAVRTNAIGAIFGHAETLQSTLGTAFGDTIDAYAVSTIFGHDRCGGLLRGNLRQGKYTGRQSGNNEAGEDLLFHGRSPEEGVSNWLRLSCYARPGMAKGTSRDSDHRRHR